MTAPVQRTDIDQLERPNRQRFSRRCDFHPGITQEVTPKYVPMIPTTVPESFHRDGWAYDEKIDAGCENHHEKIAVGTASGVISP